jgi:hemerythrin-like domain-containing protein
MPKAKPLNAIAMLEEDHKYVRKAFRDFEKMDHDDLEAVQAVVDQVCAALLVHAQIEEEIFYPAARRALKDEDLMNEAKVEHDSAKTLIRQLKRMKAGDAEFVATFTVLGEYVNHHIKEEESEMFPKARRRGLNLAALGKKLMARKVELGP